MIKAADEIFRLQEENKKLKDGIKQTIKEIGNLPVEYSTLIDGVKVLSILDKLIAESEVDNETTN